MVIGPFINASAVLLGGVPVNRINVGNMHYANGKQQIAKTVSVDAGEIPENADLKTLVGNGYVVITITPSEGERYQGVVGLEGDTLAACLEDYFMRSEQLPTRQTGRYLPAAEKR